MKKIFTLLAMLFSLPSLTFASSVLRSDTVVSVLPDQVVSGDFYSLGKDSVLISGKVDGDLISASSNIGIVGLVAGDVLAIAAKIEISGEVNGDVRVVADKVLITGKIKGNLAVVAKDVSVLPSAEITGDVLMFGASPMMAETSATLSGLIGGNIYGDTDNIRLDGKVVGVVEIKARNLVLGDSADIPQYVKYESMNELLRSPNSVVGSVVRSDPAVFVNKNSDLVKFGIKTMLINLFASLVLFLLFRGFMERVASQAKAFSLRNFAIGFGVLILAPVAATVLFFSTLGILLSTTIMIIYFLWIVVAFILAGPVLGYFTSSLWAKKSEVSIISIVAGVTIVNLAFYVVPDFSMIFVISLFAITLGAVAISTYRFLRSG